MRILGLDLSLSATGVALLNDDGGLQEAWRIRSKNTMSDIERCAYTAGSIMAMIYGTEGVTMPGFAEPSVDFVAIEAIFASRNLEVYRRLAELSAVVQYNLYRARIPYQLYPVYQWRKLLFGVGSKITQKDQVRAAVQGRFQKVLPDVDLEHLDENVMEAWCVAYACRREKVDGIAIAPPTKKRASRKPVEVSA